VTEPTPFLFRWCRAVKDSDLHPTTRHVLRILADYGDVHGSDIRPGTRALAHDTGLSRPTVMHHLEAAEQGGWIIREVAGPGRGQGWKRHRYELRIPGKVVKEFDHEGGQEVLPRQGEGGQTDEQGGQIDGGKVVKGFDLTFPTTSPETSPSPPEGTADAAAPRVDESSEQEAATTTPDSDRLSAGDLVAAWVRRQPHRPPASVIRKQGAAAKRLVSDADRPTLERAVEGIGRLYPHSEGEPWDLFDLEKKMAKALAAPEKRNGRGARAPRQPDTADLAAWNTGGKK
jgi:DNA-binding transcriptional ArsR family regulator